MLGIWSVYVVCACLCTLCMLLLSLHVCCAVVPFERDENKDFEQGRKKNHCGNAEWWNANLLYCKRVGNELVNCLHRLEELL